MQLPSLRIKCLGVLLLLWLALLRPLLLLAQPAFIPYTRNDSAQMAVSDSMYTYHLGRGNLKEASRHLDMNAMLFWKHNDLKRAEEYFLRSLKHNEQLGNLNGIAGINSNLAFIYSDMAEYEKSYDYFEKTLAVRKSSGNSVAIIAALVNESVVLNNLTRYSESIEKLEEALRYARELQDEKQMRSVYGMLSETYQKAGNVDKALYYYEYYKTFNDYVTERRVAQAYSEVERAELERENLRLENQNKELLLERQRWELAQREGQLSVLSAEQQQLMDSLTKQEMANQILENRNEQQRLHNELLLLEKKRARWAFSLVAVVAVLVAGFLVVTLLHLRQRNRLNRRLNEYNATILAQSEKIREQNVQLQRAIGELEQKNRETLDSIRYSRRIQGAALSHNVPLSDLFEGSFIFERPFAIVSGDFYYVRQLSDGIKVVVVGDCTGHGVPGAFLTVLAVTVLDRALYDMRLRHCAKILEEIDRSFGVLNGAAEISTLSMDVGVCLIDEKAGKLHFAGAQHGLLVAGRNGSQFIRGSRMMVGQKYSTFSIAMRAPQEVIVPLEPGQWFYLSSDGVADQFSPRHEKFSSRRLHELLAGGASLSPDAQQERLTKAVDAWQGNEPQIDDMLVVGFRAYDG